MQCVSVLVGFLSLVAAEPTAPLAATPAAAAPSTLTWAQVEPLVRARFAVRQHDQGMSCTSEAPIPEGLGPEQTRSAVNNATDTSTDAGRNLAQRCALDFAHAMPELAKRLRETGLDSATQRLRELAFTNPRTLRLIQGAVAESLALNGIACADCAPPETAIRSVAFREFTPYLSRFITVGKGDLGLEIEHTGFHICSGLNGLAGMEKIDPDLGAVALSAMYRSTRDNSSALEGAGGHVLAARRNHPGPETPEILAAVNADTWEALANDTGFLDEMRIFVASEASIAGIACPDCLPPAKAPDVPTRALDASVDAEGALRLSPFQAIKWNGDIAQVEVRDAWFELRAIDDLPAERIIAFCHAAYGEIWKKRFEEDLVAVLHRMGHATSADVDLTLARSAASDLVRLKHVPMTKANRDAIWAAAAHRPQ